MRRLPPSVTRRDFVNGVAITVGAATVAPQAAFAAGKIYPPALDGLRGAHVGSFEAAHALAREGVRWPRPAAQTDSDYDLVIAGAGISGLAAAYFYRRDVKPDARILILDNHDDFGGHAKRNEFTVNGRTLIGYGGSQSLDNPSHFSAGAKGLLAELGVKPKRFRKFFDQGFYESRGLGPAIYYDRPHYGEDKLAPLPFGWWSGTPDAEALQRAIAAAPIGDADRDSLAALVRGGVDYLAGMTTAEKIDRMRRMSYERFLEEHAGATETVRILLRRTITGLWGVGWDCLSALEAARNEMPGTGSLDIEDAIPNPYDHDEPYIFHFPDGNASIARLLVRKLIGGVAPGDNMEDIVTASVDYAALDRPDADVRIRLNSTVVELQNDEGGVDAIYVRGGKAERVRARHAIFAGYMHMAPHVAPELADAQREAISVAVKIPLVYVNVALTNWRAFASAGAHRIYSPQAFFESMSLDFPVSMGGYDFSSSPDDPIIAHLQHVPIAPGLGLDERTQHRTGRSKLLELSFAEFEHAVVAQLEDALGAHGFVAERDIAGVTVNRWPHGYAYEYNELYDPWDWSPEAGPHVEARKPVGAIHFAGSDTGAYAYVDGAIDAALRAVNEIRRS